MKDGKIKKMVVFDSHPVQYRVPVWRAIEASLPGSIHVVYASDCSVRGHADKGFGQTIAWDDPMLDGYSYTILNCEKGVPLSGPGSLTGEGVDRCLEEFKPDVVLLTGLNYQYDKVVCREANRRNIPVWLRCETQDEAMVRSGLKTMARFIFYRLWYKRISKAFYIGQLNQKHYLRHGIKKKNLIPAFYSTINRFHAIDSIQKEQLRQATRVNAGIPTDALVIGFSGKFISKKNPEILFSVLEKLSGELRDKVCLYFMGSGELKEELEQLAIVAREKYNVATFFPGFINQSEIARHYLAIDVLILPSRRRGETWGLVSNEAMQAGCSVIVSNAVGCYADFSGWERFRVFEEGNTIDLAKQVKELASYSRTFDWAEQQLQKYSIEAVAQAFIKEMKNQY
ncbi:MAG: glycosyltransferase family 4 protein [Chitinophagaceae bacterium]